MSLLGKNRKCNARCATCIANCNLHFKHSGCCYCESIDCALERIKMKCSNVCAGCHSICSLEQYHSDKCFCGNANHQWQASDYVVDQNCNSACDEIKSHKTQSVSQTRRPTWHETWMEFAHTVACRSHDSRLKVGAIVVADDNTAVLALGYNGDHSGGPNTPESTEPGQSGFLHAEANALLKCPYHYPTGKIMYVTDSPCRQCAKFIINARIKMVVYDREYRDTSGLDLLRQSGIIVHKLSGDLLHLK